MVSTSCAEAAIVGLSNAPTEYEIAGDLICHFNALRPPTVRQFSHSNAKESGARGR
jgi:hypothetical protein